MTTEKKKKFESPLSKYIRLFCSQCKNNDPNSLNYCMVNKDRMKNCIFCALLFGYDCALLFGYEEIK